MLHGGPKNPSTIPRRAKVKSLGIDAQSRIFTRTQQGNVLRQIGLCGAVFALFALSAFCHGEHWPLLVGVLMVRAFLISFLDNVYHYRTPVNDCSMPITFGSPQWLSRALLYFNLHGIHHRNPSLPWIVLPEAFGEASGRFGGNYFSAAIRQLNGPLALSQLPSRSR